MARPLAGPAAVRTSIAPVPPAVTASPSFPRLASTLPAVEGPILGALRARGLSGRVARIAADTNGRLTIAALVMTYRGDAANPSPALLSAVWSRARAAFEVVPNLDELHVMAFHQGDGPFDATRRDVTFSAAFSRGAYQRLLRRGEDAARLPELDRLWIHPLLEAAAGRTPGLQTIARPAPQAHTGLESRPRFSGDAGEHAAERSHRTTGLTGGGVVAGKIYRGDPNVRHLALTFDDGPLPIYTTLLLDTLRQLGIRATFFLIGQRARQFPYFARAITDAGHEVANHTHHHVNLTRVSERAVEDELVRAQAAIEEVTGKRPVYFRPPDGDYDNTVLRVAARVGLTTVFWTDDPADYALIGPARLEARLLAAISNGGILLLHQGVEDTVRVLPDVMGILRRRDFAIGTVTALISR